MDFYADYGRFKGYATPGLKAKHRRRLDREFGRPLGLRPEHAVLEIGCGTGQFLAYLAAVGVRTFVGVDHDPSLAAVVPEAVRDHFVAADVWDFLARQDGQARFDRVVMTDVLEHFTVDDGVRLLRALRPLLAPQARVLVRVPNVASPWGAQFQYGDLTHRAAYTPASLRQLAITAGYRCRACLPHYLGSGARRARERVFHRVVSWFLGAAPDIMTANVFALFEPDAE